MLNYDQYHREPLLSSIRWPQEPTVQKQNNNSRALKNVNNHPEAVQAGASGRAPIRRQDPPSDYGFSPPRVVPNNEFNNYYSERAHLPEISAREIYYPHHRQPPSHTFEYDDIENNRFDHTTKPVTYNLPHINNYSNAPPDHCRPAEEVHRQFSYNKVNKDDGPFVFGVHSPSQFRLEESKHDNTYDYANDEESDKSVIDNESNVLYCDKKINVASNMNADSGRSTQGMFRIRDTRKIKKDNQVKLAKEPECQKSDVKEKHKIKCVFVGDGAVGKTSLITTYAQNTFTDSYKPTAFDNYNVVVEVDKRPISVDICDTAGQDSLEELTELCYPGTDVIILCFSVVKPSSFDSVIKRWAPCVAVIKAPLVLVGTQSDLRYHPDILRDLKERGEEPVSESNARFLASSLNAPYIETSAKMRSRLKDTFDSAILAALPVVIKKESIWKKMFCLS